MNLNRTALFALFCWLAGCETSPASDAERSAVALEPAVSAASTAPNAPLVSDEARLCAEVCRRSAALRCEGQAECSEQCRAMASLTRCRQTFLGFYRCLIDEPVEHWECDEAGLATIREGYCEREQADALSCLQQNDSAVPPH